MGAGESKQVVPTTIACIVPRESKLSQTAFYFLTSEDKPSLRECIDVRAYLRSLAPIGALVAQPRKPAGANESQVTSYKYTWPEPDDERLRELWKYTEHTLKVTTKPGPVETHVTGKKVVPLSQMLASWYPAPLPAQEVHDHANRFDWHRTKELLSTRLTHDAWKAWHDRVHPGPKFGTWDATLDAIIAHFQAVMRAEMCTVSQKCIKSLARKRV